jgi:uncharacterized membrane protein YfcA
VLLPMLWSAVTTIPSAERLEQSHMVAIPTLGMFVQVALLSAAELAITLALIWPRWLRAYTVRIFFAALLLTAWFLATTPLGMSRLQWTHRRWLALVVLVLLLFGAYEALRSIRQHTRDAQVR